MGKRVEYKIPDFCSDCIFDIYSAHIHKHFCKNPALLNKDDFLYPEIQDSLTESRLQACKDLGDSITLIQE